MALKRGGAPAVLAGAIALSSWLVPAQAQAPASTPAARTVPAAPPDSVLPALLVEVRGLRAAMEKMASAGAQSQLLVGRLQLQESRINGMIRRLDTVRDALAAARQELEKKQSELRSLQTPADPGEKAEGFAAIMKMFAPAQIEELQRETAAGQERVNHLAVEEADLQKQIAVEQTRWMEINQRLDELERSLKR